MSAAFTLRDMTAGDLPAVMAIELGAFESPWTLADYRSALAGRSRCRVAVDPDGALLGYCVTGQALDEAEVYTIAVSPRARRRGVGRALLRDFFSFSKAGGVSRIFLEVRPSNAAARSLYAGEGFVQVGRRRGYYSCANGGREDALIMERSEPDAA